RPSRPSVRNAEAGLPRSTGRASAAGRHGGDAGVGRGDGGVDLGVEVLDVLAEAVEDGDAGGGQEGDEQRVLDDGGPLLGGGELLGGGGELRHRCVSFESATRDVISRTWTRFDRQTQGSCAIRTTIVRLVRDGYIAGTIPSAGRPRKNHPSPLLLA